MAVEGGGAYRQSLIRKDKTKKDIAALRQRQKKDPLRWTTEKDPNKGFLSFAKSALNQGYRTRYPTTSPGEEYYRQTATAFARGANYNTLITPSEPVKRKMGLDVGRALEGLLQERPSAAYSRGPGLELRRPLKEEMQQFGDQFYNPQRDRGETFMEDIIEGVRESPRTAYEASLLGLLAEAGRVTNTGRFLNKALIDAQKPGIIKDIISNPMIGGPGGMLGIRPGTTLAMREEFTRPATTTDYISFGSNFIPGIGGVKTAGKAAVMGGKGAARAGRSAAAGGREFASQSARMGITSGFGPDAPRAIGKAVMDKWREEGGGAALFDPNFSPMKQGRGQDITYMDASVEGDIVRRWEIGEFEQAFDVLDAAWANRGDSQITSINNVPPALVEALSRGISPQEIRMYSDDILRGSGDPSMTMPGRRIEIIWDRDPSKDADQFVRVRGEGIKRVSESSDLPKDYIASDKIDRQMAVEEYARFREETNMPAEIKIYNSDTGELSQVLHPHVDHFVSQAAAGAYAKVLRKAGKSSLAKSLIDAVNNQQNMLVYYAPDNVNKGRMSPDVWEAELEKVAPLHYQRVHGEGTYAANRYQESRNYWRSVLGDEEYEQFMSWYNAESRKGKPIKVPAGRRPAIPEEASVELYPVEDNTQLLDYMRQLQGR